MSASAPLEAWPPDLAERVAQPLHDLDDVTIERICRAILTLSAAHASRLPFLGALPSPSEERAARKWFRDDSRAFRLVCRWAGVPAEHARRSVLGTGRLEP